MTVANIGSAILLVGVMWFGYHYGADIYIVGLALLAVATWAYSTGADEQKTLLRSQARYYDARARFYENSQILKEKPK